MEVNSGSISFGPYYSGWSGPFLLNLEVDGEFITSSFVESGYCNKGIERLFIGKDPRFCLPFIDRLDSENSVFCERLFCEAIEKMLKIIPPQRSLDIRSIFCELTRISTHLLCVSRIARATGSETACHFFLRERESVLELFELISGARFSLNFLKVGGVANDISDGFLEKVNNLIIRLRLRLREYNDLITYNYAFIGRLAGIGVLSSEEAKECGLTGVNLRASGVSIDLRDRDFENLCAFSISVGSGEMGELGDCFDRFLIRLREISSSLDILSYLIKNIQKGPFDSPEIEFSFKEPIQLYHSIETPRGLLGCFIGLSENGYIENIHFRVPSLFSLFTFSKMLHGQRLRDIDVIYSSLDISIAEADK